jgi:hypothetical protein
MPRMRAPLSSQTRQNGGDARLSPSSMLITYRDQCCLVER